MACNCGKAAPSWLCLIRVAGTRFSVSFPSLSLTGSHLSISTLMSKMKTWFILFHGWGRLVNLTAPGLDNKHTDSSNDLSIMDIGVGDVFGREIHGLERCHSM